jgi:hypothetical protein
MSSLDSSSEEEVDFNVFRKEYESNEHFNLRKSFIEKFWDQIETEDEILVRLSVLNRRPLSHLSCLFSARLSYSSTSSSLVANIHQRSCRELHKCQHKFQRFNAIDKTERTTLSDAS